ncbi:MAG: Dabb family protein [Nocardioides sp.]|uniref:aspartate racemase/maleate isomerase family protein n=1 Tax=Nocardioides sp. TaxID=35761 RepID=UPI003F0D4412
MTTAPVLGAVIATPETKGKKFALVLPSTNTSVEREFHHVRPQDCSWHTGRIMIKAPALDSADAFGAFRECLNAALPDALEVVMTCKPDYIVMGMSAETFWGGVQGNAAFQQNVRDLTGLEVTTGATAAGEALKAFGAKRIGIVTPYQPVGDEQVVDYFTELGFDVAAIKGLCSASATSIADETPETLREAFLAVDGPDVDALIQCGTNLESPRWRPSSSGSSASRSSPSTSPRCGTRSGSTASRTASSVTGPCSSCTDPTSPVVWHPDAASRSEWFTMFNHVGHLTLTVAPTSPEVSAIADALLALPGQVPGLVSAEVVPDAGLTEGNATLRFHMRFDSRVAWEGYKAHPAHVAVISDHIVRCSVRRPSRSTTTSRCVRGRDDSRAGVEAYMIHTWPKAPSRTMTSRLPRTRATDSSSAC